MVAFLSDRVFEVDGVAGAGVEVETEGVALMEVKRDGMVIEPEEDESDGDPVE